MRSESSSDNPRCIKPSLPLVAKAARTRSETVEEGEGGKRYSAPPGERATALGSGVIGEPAMNQRSHARESVIGKRGIVRHSDRDAVEGPTTRRARTNPPFHVLPY